MFLIFIKIKQLKNIFNVSTEDLEYVYIFEKSLTTLKTAKYEDSVNPFNYQES